MNRNQIEEEIVLNIYNQIKFGYFGSLIFAVTHILKLVKLVDEIINKYG